MSHFLGGFTSSSDASAQNPLLGVELSLHVLTGVGVIGTHKLWLCLAVAVFTLQSGLLRAVATYAGNRDSCCPTDTARHPDTLPLEHSKYGTCPLAHVVLGTVPSSHMPPIGAWPRCHTSWEASRLHPMRRRRTRCSESSCRCTCSQGSELSAHTNCGFALPLLFLHFSPGCFVPSLHMPGIETHAARRTLLAILTHSHSSTPNTAPVRWHTWCWVPCRRRTCRLSVLGPVVTLLGRLHVFIRCVGTEPVARSRVVAARADRGRSYRHTQTVALPCRCCFYTSVRAASCRRYICRE